MASKPKMPMRPTFPDSVLLSISALSLEEAGALYHIENHMWANGGYLKYDDKHIARLLRISTRKWASIKAALQDRFQVNEGKFTTLSVLNGYEESVERSKTNSENAKARWNKDSKNKTPQQASAYASSNGSGKTQRLGERTSEIIAQTHNALVMPR